MFQVMVFLESMTVQGLKKYLLLSGFDIVSSFCLKMAFEHVSGNAVS